MKEHGGDIYSHPAVLDFSTNINPAAMPDSIEAAAVSGIQRSESYPDPDCMELRRAISAYYKVPYSNIICANGAVSLIYSIAAAVRPKNAVLIAPSFSEYENALRSVECNIDYYALKEENGFLLTESAPLITDETDIVFLCNPNNPTGQLVLKSFLQNLVFRLKKKGAVLVIDECFMDFIADSEPYSMVDEILNHKNLFILKAFTKLYSIPGLRLGYGLSGDKQLINKIQSCTPPWSVSIPAQYAGIAALKETSFVEKSLLEMEREKKYLINGLEKKGCRIVGSKANYIFFHYNKDLYNHCLSHNILIRDCSNFHGLYEGWYRIGVKDHASNEEFIRVLNLS